jgi:transmembrane sensor
VTSENTLDDEKPLDEPASHWVKQLPHANADQKRMFLDWASRSPAHLHAFVRAQIREDEKTARRRLTLKAVVVLILAGAALVTDPFLHEHVVLPLLAEFRGAPVSQPPARWCARDEHESIPLPDGSRLELNSGACVSTEIAAERRTVKLESGEVIFQVAHDPRRPFVVEAGPISIEDVGTAFVVYRTGLSTRVAVIEGAVQIPSRGTNQPPLTALQLMDVPDDPGQASVRKLITPGDLERMTAWAHDIEFHNQPLKEVMDEFARRQHIQVEFAEPRIGEVRISGGFNVTDVESFLRLLKHRCIQSRYDKAAQRITLARGADEPDVCR